MKRFFIKLTTALLLCVSLQVVAQDYDTLMFVRLSEAVPDIILEIRYFSTYNFVGTRIDGYEAPIALLTRRAADSLQAVSDELIEKEYCAKS